MDRIVMQNTMARAAGMTYGKWKALHPESEKVEDDKLEETYLRKCQWCGKKIPLYDINGKKVRWDKKWCSTTCGALSAYYRKKDCVSDG